jgi:hypothetical protein
VEVESAGESAIGSSTSPPAPSTLQLMTSPLSAQMFARAVRLLNQNSLKIMELPTEKPANEERK